MTAKQIKFMTAIMSGQSFRLGGVVYSLKDHRQTICSGDDGEYLGSREIEGFHEPSPEHPDGAFSSYTSICDLLDLLDHVESVG